MWYPVGHRFFELITSQWIQKGLQKPPPLDPPLYWMHPWGPSFEASCRIIIDDILDSWCSSKLDLTDWWNYWLIDWLIDWLIFMQNILHSIFSFRVMNIAPTILWKIVVCEFFNILSFSFSNIIIIIFLIFSLDITLSGGKLTYTVEEAIDKLGYGPFQVKLMFVIGLAWVRVKILLWDFF